MDLKKIDFSCDTPALLLDAHAGGSGDVTGRFAAYSHDVVLAQLVRALKYLRPDVPEDMILKILATLENAPCEAAMRSPFAQP